VVLVTVIVFLMLAEAALVVAVFVSPSAGNKLESVAASADRAWNGTEREIGLRTRTAQVAHRTYEEWITPLWKGPKPPPADPEFTQCVECHPDYARQRRFNVYMNHPLHAEIGVACETCHPQNPHPNPPRPQEAVCADCHSEVQQQDSCGFCHPPGSLPHFYLLGAPRTAAVRCDVCHPTGTFETQATHPQIHEQTFDGSDKGTCLSCHPDSACDRCHATPHPSDWLQTHGRGVAYSGAGTCVACHPTDWCAARCHSVTQFNPFRPQPLPSVGVRP
jgi:hypothetical protein